MSLKDFIKTTYSEVYEGHNVNNIIMKGMSCIMISSAKNRLTINNGQKINKSLPNQYSFSY